MTGIREYFAELSGDEPDWFQLAFCFERAQEALDEAKRDWRQRNRLHHRLYLREWRARREIQPRQTVTAESKREKARARKQRWLAANRERQREHHRKWKEKARAA